MEDQSEELSSPNKQNPLVKKDYDSSDEDDINTLTISKTRKRVQQLSNSETEEENNVTTVKGNKEAIKSSSDNDSDAQSSHKFKSRIMQSRIQMNDSSSDSEAPEAKETIKNQEQQLRLQNKKSKLKNKFKGLLSSRNKSVQSENQPERKASDSENEENQNSVSETSENEMSSISKIKQKIKSAMTKIPSICDPDTSEDEDVSNKKAIPKKSQKKKLKATKLIEAKPMRMSAKQAMENMQMIKSESNRMLREKAVSLPYHRPKALSLKDIMARRKPALSSDGKALPIKMNEDQLKQYAMQLEQRQKEMMELCKSESDEEIDEPNNEEISKEPETKDNETVVNIEPSNNTEEKDSNFNLESEVNGEKNSNIITITSDFVTCNSEDIDNITNKEDITNKEVDKKANDSIESEHIQNDSNTDMKLVYNDDSIEEEAEVINEFDNTGTEGENTKEVDIATFEEQRPVNTEQDSQLISLHYTENNTEVTDEKPIEITDNDDTEIVSKENYHLEPMDLCEDEKHDDLFSDDDLIIENIDELIENAEIMKDDNVNVNSPMLIKDDVNIKPKLTGAPGMVIDLDNNTSFPKRSGIDLLKERFTYFSKLKTREELEREREKTIKPGAQHLKLRQELEEQIAEQRSLEWAKRLEEKNKQQEEVDAILDDADNLDDSIEKMEKCLDKEDVEKDESSSESEEELVENDIEIKDKPVKRNPMLDDEAEESDIDDNQDESPDKIVDENDSGNDENESDDNDESSDESSESEEEQQSRKPKKGRILKAFEDSDDEGVTKDELENTDANTKKPEEVVNIVTENSDNVNDAEPIVNSCELPFSSQDDVLQLAQLHKSTSDDLFTSQEQLTPNNKDCTSDDLVATQSFSISTANPTDFLDPSQPYHDPALNAVTDGFSQNILGAEQYTQSSQSIGEDILALCTGKFYDNKFVSQTDENITETISQGKISEDGDGISTDHNKEMDTVCSNSEAVDPIINDELHTVDTEKNIEETKDSNTVNNGENEKTNEKKVNVDENLTSILNELDDPEFDNPKPNKYFTGGTQTKNALNENSNLKKRFIIDSDDENSETNAVDAKKKKKNKKKKLEDRALQISDDEDEENELGLDDEEVSDLEEDGERVVEYDSEENEIEVIKQDKPKKKRKGTDFFEDEAELTSEDEWVGSGDEDERDLDRMEREEGDDEVFHQGKLRKELGQIHMRDVLDQDKREVRLLQELLFEDGDLGGGHRQRKFRWRNTDDDEGGTVPNDLTDTQEEEFESEEQWRKQRHEREMFLRQMQNQGETVTENVTLNRTAIIKANLSSKSMSTLLMEVNQTTTEKIESPVVAEKTTKNIPSPKKPFSILQQNYQGSILNRGRGALARLAALATPLAGDDDAPKIASLGSHKRNFVFAALTQEEEKPKVTIKRKVDAGTPKLVKKMRIEDKQTHPKSSLLDHFTL